jgi:hypothetical protein
MKESFSVSSKIRQTANDFLALFNYLASIAEIRPDEAKTFNAEAFRRKVRDLFISPKIWGNQTEAGVEEIFQFYVGNSTGDNVFYLNAYTTAIHDCYFGVPAKIEMMEKMRCGWPVYNGLFDRLHTAMHPPNVPLKGSVVSEFKMVFSVPTHGSEYIYLFGHLKDTEQLFNEEDKQYRDFWIESIVEFVKSGTPTQWEQATPETPGVALRVNDGAPIVEHGLLEKELEFWTEMNKRCGYNIVRQIPLEQ